jgi:hypothetical protein
VEAAIEEGAEEFLAPVSIPLLQIFLSFVLMAVLVLLSLSRLGITGLRVVSVFVTLGTSCYNSGR